MNNKILFLGSALMLGCMNLNAPVSAADFSVSTPAALHTAIGSGGIGTTSGTITITDNLSVGSLSSFNNVTGSITFVGSDSSSSANYKTITLGGSGSRKFNMQGSGKASSFQYLRLTGGTATAVNNTAQAVTIKDCLVNYNNNGSNGGAIITNGSNASTSIQNSTLSNNTSGGNGGAIFTTSSGSANLSGTNTVSSNLADNGGAIANSGGSVNISGATTFNGNTATATGTSNGGGAIYNTGSNSSVNVSGASFTSNSGQNGGAIFNNAGGSGAVTVTSGAFTNNAATTNGGAIYNTGTVNLRADAGNISFSGNTMTNGAKVNDVYTTGTVNVDGNTAANTVSIGGGFAGSGTITKTGASGLLLDTTSDSSTYTGAFNQTGGGTTTVKGKFFGGTSTITGGTLSWLGGTTSKVAASQLKVNGGNLNVGQGANNGTLVLNNAGDTIAAAATVNIKSGSAIQNQLGNVTINAGDTWDGTIDNAATVTVDNFQKTNGESVVFTQTASTGILNLQNSSTVTFDNSSITAGAMNINTGGYFVAGSGTTVDTGAVVSLNGDGTMRADGGGTINIDSGDTWAGMVFAAGGTLNISGLSSNGKLIGSYGSINLISGTLAVANGSSISAQAVTDIAAGTTTNLSGTGSISLNSGDSWAGAINQTGGTLDYANLTTNGAYTGTAGNLNVNSGILNIASGSSIGTGMVTNIALTGAVNASGGQVNMGNDDTWTGAIAVNGGTLNIASVSSNGKLEGNTGAVDLQSGSLNLATGSYINTTVATNLAAGTTTNVAGGHIAMNSNDTWLGTINQSSGTMSFLDLTTNGVYTGTGGTLNVFSGNMKIASGSSIGAGVAANVMLTSGITIDGTGTVSLNSGDTWSGTITQIGGTFNYNDLTTNGAYAGTAGNLNLNSGQFNIKAGDSLGANVVTNLTSNGALNVVGGTTAFNAGDTWAGAVSLSSGTLSFGDISNTGTLDATGGILNATSGTLNIGTSSQITDAVATTFTGTSTVNISGGSVSLNSGDDWSGDINLTNGTLSYSDLISNGKINTTGGNLLINSGDLIIAAGSSIGSGTNTLVANGAMVEITGGNTTLDANDVWAGDIYISAGNLTLDGFTKNTTGGTLNQSGGTTTLQNGANYTMGSETVISAGAFNINSNSNLILTSTADLAGVETLGIATGGTMYAGGNTFVTQNVVMNNGFINAISGTLTTTSTMQSLAVGPGDANFAIDLNAFDWTSDVFNLGNVTGPGNINISDYNVIGRYAVDEVIPLHIFDVTSIASDVTFSATDKPYFTPIGKYKLLTAPTPGDYNLTRVGWNPQAFRGQVATLAAYQNQLLVNNALFDHVYLDSETVTAYKQDNKYAAISPLFAPYQYRREEGSIWSKTYVAIERLAMTQGLRVNNNAYGQIVGADFPAVKLKDGWEFLPTAYIAYNGGHQTYEGVSMYQNGGQGGFMGTFMKDDFIGSFLAYGGGYYNEMSVQGFTDHAGNWFAGTAVKAAYNFHPTKHFIIQPNALVSYNIFGKQSWGSDYGVYSMNSGFLNGVNVAPGLNLIYGRETWSVYFTTQYMYNINDSVNGRANNINFPKVSMQHGWIEYGVGATKTWKERLMGYCQFVIRNGGRSGVGFQFGLTYKL